MGRFGSFSDNFYQFIKERIGITHLYEINDAKISFEERLEKIALMLERAEFDDDKLSANEQALNAFSDEAIELSAIVKKIGLQKEICNKQFLTKHFKTFYFKRSGIEQLDQHIELFTNLTVLNLSFNKLETLQYLPPNLKELSLAANQIFSLRAGLSVPSLIHLGLSYNKIADGELAKICHSFPNLFSIDLSFNQVCSLTTVVDNLTQLKSVKMINFKGNPVVLSKDYRAIMKQRFQHLVKLDGTTAFSEAEEAAKKKKKTKRDAYGNVILDTSDQIPIKKAVTFELSFRLLSNCSGVYLGPDNCPEGTIDLSAVAAEKKSSVFSMSYVDHEGKQVTTTPKVWINDFQVDKEANLGKTDFHFDIKIDIPEPTVALRDWLMNDLFVELKHSKPIFREKKNEDDSIGIEVVIQDGQPVVEQNIIGVSILTV